MSSPEVARVYVGSFWDQPLNNKENADLFEKEEKDLMNDLAVLPRQSAVRKINEVRWNKVETTTTAFVFVFARVSYRVDLSPTRSFHRLSLHFSFASFVPYSWSKEFARSRPLHTSLATSSRRCRR